MISSMSNLVVPDASRAQRLSDEVNRRLCASLRYVFDAVGSELGVDKDITAPWLERLEEARRSFPLVHASYHALVADVQTGDLAQAKTEAARLLGYDLGTPAGLSIVNLDGTALGADAIPLFSRFADIEEENRLDLVVAQERDVDRFIDFFDVARDLMSKHHPELLDEFEALVDTVILVGQADRHRFALGAVSCFQTWGGLFVNPALQGDALDLIGTIAHECTHLKLFALALDEPIVSNPRDERHYSPLREAPRSMDGIFHATIVSARMAYAFLRQYESRALPLPLAMIAPRRIGESTRLFYEGLAIIRQNGRLTPLGETILNDAVVLMDKTRARAIV